ncbi:MAG: hypothetical protein HYW37_01210 [Candidatus Colwellbacteria bacterium]|nr:hypothetical protein [Candidatus Colwellbacteria bacterium]
MATKFTIKGQASEWFKDPSFPEQLARGIARFVSEFLQVVGYSGEVRVEHILGDWGGSRNDHADFGPDIRLILVVRGKKETWHLKLQWFKDVSMVAPNFLSFYCPGDEEMKPEDFHKRKKVDLPHIKAEDLADGIRGMLWMVIESVLARTVEDLQNSTNKTMHDWHLARATAPLTKQVK